jgi:hypothetical protein
VPIQRRLRFLFCLRFVVFVLPVVFGLVIVVVIIIVVVPIVVGALGFFCSSTAAYLGDGRLVRVASNFDARLLRLFQPARLSLG